MTFRKLHKKYSQLPLSRDIWETDEYNEWVEHTHYCKDCSDWSQAEEVRGRGEDVSNFPCVHIAYHVTTRCEQHSDPFDCADIIIVYNKATNKYGIPIRDGGHSVVDIEYCPWCGIELN